MVERKESGEERGQGRVKQRNKERQEERKIKGPKKIIFNRLSALNFYHSGVLIRRFKFIT